MACMALIVLGALPGHGEQSASLPSRLVNRPRFVPALLDAVQKHATQIGASIEARRARAGRPISGHTERFKALRARDSNAPSSPRCELGSARAGNKSHQLVRLSLDSSARFIQTDRPMAMVATFVKMFKLDKRRRRKFKSACRVLSMKPLDH